MRTPFTAGAALATAATATVAGLVGAATRPSAGQPAPADAIATLLTPDGDMRLTLTARSITVGYTAQGEWRVRRSADSAFASAEGPRTPDGRRAGKHEVKAPHEKPIPLRELGEVRTPGDSLVLCFAARPGTGESACGPWRRIVVAGLAPADARRFASAVRRARDADAAR